MSRKNVAMEEPQCKVLDLPSAEALRRSILHIKKPVVIKKSVESWPILKWSLVDWKTALGDVKLPFRTGSSDCTQVPQWEGSCKMLNYSVEEFLSITENQGKQDWLYFDYKYMHEWFKNHPTILESVSWARLGFTELKGIDSTMWLGSKGAHTPCHKDSYGLNLVAQLYGKKAWILFSPDDDDSLQPTRIPYEESSIFSKINFFCRKSLRGFKKAYFVILNPGDVLVVPNGWWHYVENIETSISINTWVPLEIDDEKRVEECLVRTFIGSLLENLDDNERRFLLNPNEVEQFRSFDASNTDMLNLCVENVNKRKSDTDSNEKEALQLQRQFFESPLIKFVENCDVTNISEQLQCTCNDYNSSCVTQESSYQEIDFEKVVNAFCHPEVIAKVRENCL
ncbi:HSPB1-associated protein 1 homolog isoform X3 [Nilaparvata lugens]|uniref:HSPB1-associated protein 1 homolog isoform X3 n=1 Tax=Nilaparvata lugens TaxID=108931 RepID=UPI00193DDE65|nr:HSPB1-associated protein 1 homolog isoform X3 [Nilaparvata lugens]